MPYAIAIPNPPRSAGVHKDNLLLPVVLSCVFDVMIGVVLAALSESVQYGFVPPVTCSHGVLNYVFFSRISSASFVASFIAVLKLDRISDLLAYFAFGSGVNVLNNFGSHGLIGLASSPFANPGNFPDANGILPFQSYLYL